MIALAIVLAFGFFATRYRPGNKPPRSSWSNGDWHD